tara:strand:+ start:291 stop:953 length:663 start_codon:yes stop_codon:yes gene_type:complete
MTFPNLAGLIKKDDVYQKGSGNFTANYVAWARIAQLLHEHAPGVDFHLEPTKEGSIIHKAPDGTGYVLCYFTNADGFSTSQFPFPCMDHRNNPIQFDKISARVLTDTHRRALCASAAFHFSLGSELWARQEIEDEGDPIQQHQSPMPQKKLAPTKPTEKDSQLQSQAAKAGAKAIANAKTLDQVAALTERLTARYTAGDLSESENQALMQMLLEQEDKIK